MNGTIITDIHSDTDLIQLIKKIEHLKKEVDTFRPLSPDVERRIFQKFRLDWNFHSNAIEGNRLTYGETRAFLLQGITAKGKPFKDYVDIKGHNEAIDYLADVIRQEYTITEDAIREIHKILLVESYPISAMTLDGNPVVKQVAIGQYKTMPNHVLTSTGETHYYAMPEEVSAKMGDLMQWYRHELAKGELHTLILATAFHHEFVNIHPFDDGNGRMARLLMNLILMQGGYVPVIIHQEDRQAYYAALESADVGELETFTFFIGERLIDSMTLYVRGAKGERIDDLGDIDKRIALLKKKFQLEHVVGAERTVETQKVFFENFLKPFSEILLTQLKKFEVFFNSSEYGVQYLKYDNELGRFYVISSQDITPLWDYLVDAYIINYKYSELITNKPYNLNVRIYFYFKQYHFELKYEIQESESHDITRSSYDKIYTKEEIEDIVLQIINHVYAEIERQSLGQT